MDMLSIIALALLAVIVLKADWLTRRARSCVGLTFHELETHMPRTEIELITGRDRKLKVVGRNDQGNAVEIDEITDATSNDVAIAQIDYEDDDKTITIEARSPGTTAVHVRADVRLGEDVREISQVLKVTVLPDEAVSLDFEDVPEAAAQG